MSASARTRLLSGYKPTESQTDLFQKISDRQDLIEQRIDNLTHRIEVADAKDKATNLAIDLLSEDNTLFQANFEKFQRQMNRNLLSLKKENSALTIFFVALAIFLIIASIYLIRKM